MSIEFETRCTLSLSCDHCGGDAVFRAGIKELAMLDARDRGWRLIEVLAPDGSNVPNAKKPNMLLCPACVQRVVC